MTSSPCHNLFEQLSHQTFASVGIRPGGLDLTRRGLDLARLAPGDAALDVGCGTGVTVTYLRCEHSIRAVGIDSSTLLVTQGRAKDSGLPLVMGDATALPFPNASFDGVLMECTLSLVPSRERALKECHRVLKPLGRLIITDLYARNPAAIDALRRLSVRSCLKGALNKERLLQECSATGFQLDCFEDHSEMLRDLAVQLVWTYGSLDRFWSETGARSYTDSEKIRHAVREARPGYLLFVGSKAGSFTGTDGTWGDE